MTETFLILLAGGCMLAAAISNPHDVTLQWLRLAGLIALCGCGLSAFFFFRREPADRQMLAMLGILGTTLAVLGQLGFVQVARRATQRTLAGVAFVLSVAAAVGLLKVPAASVIALAGVAAMLGLTLMDMLLGHAYLTASKMTIAPFLRLNRSVAIVMIARALCAVVITMVLQHLTPSDTLWNLQGLYIGTRWFVGLLVPAVFIYMAQDCIKRRSTQSATGILYVAGVLIFIGEIIALNLVHDTGLPF